MTAEMAQPDGILISPSFTIDNPFILKKGAQGKEKPYDERLCSFLFSFYAPLRKEVKRFSAIYKNIYRRKVVKKIRIFLRKFVDIRVLKGVR